MSDAERAEKIQQRLDRLGISDREFENKTGVDRKALRRAANGEPVRRSTYVAVETWLDRIEREVGLHAGDEGEQESVPGVRAIGDPADNLVEVTIEEGRVVVKGPIRTVEERDALRAFARDVIADMKVSEEAARRRGAAGT